MERRFRFRNKAQMAMNVCAMQHHQGSMYLTRTTFYVHKTGMGFTLCNHHSIKIRNWVERVAVKSSNMRRDQEIQVSRRFDLWIGVNFDNNSSYYIWFKLIQMTRRKVSGKRFCSKEITMKNFSQIHLQERFCYYLWDYKSRVCVNCIFLYLWLYDSNKMAVLFYKNCDNIFISLSEISLRSVVFNLKFYCLQI